MSMFQHSPMQTAEPAVSICLHLMLGSDSVGAAGAAAQVWGPIHEDFPPEGEHLAFQVAVADGSQGPFPTLPALKCQNHAPSLCLRSGRPPQRV
eukprot:CAMPEP_0177594702 /NCGR_PEP_ID=MMETSP0419_2-20121207/9926_1 /TAXON_ID=582737 /ORGANISM="Tetraselmis sp., Strain GSL018" /LENGTH=93 /DNA_ID=CAMNT_0019086037 /DNA_START=1188 /DNA_END=1469 /DNA_ORIENTATION=-